MSDIIDRANDLADWQRKLALEKALKKRPALSAVFEEINGEQVQLCAECDEEIPAQRLRALPEAVLCIDCQSVWEKHL